MNPLEELSRLLQAKDDFEGEIVSIESGSAIVSTRKGPIHCSVNTQTLLSPGDRVRVKAGMVVSKLLSTPDSGRVFTV
jgi:hypothetical protein